MRSMMANRQDFERHLRTTDLLLVPPIPATWACWTGHRHTELSQQAYGWGLKEIARLRAEGHPALGGGGSVTSPDTSYSTPLISLDAVALDTETTGLDARIARLVQIGG